MGLSLHRHELYQLRAGDAGGAGGGRDATSGKVFLPQEQALSKGNFTHFDEVLACWDKQIRYYTRKSIEIEYVVDTVLEENAHDILCSALVDDCIERAKSIKQGGAKYDWVSGLQVGIANLGNSGGGEKLVFEQGAVAQQLAEALASDYDGLTHEQLRQRLINGAPKYGNDDDNVDALLVRAYQTYIDEIKTTITRATAAAQSAAITMRAPPRSPLTCRSARRPWRRPMAVKPERRWRKAQVPLPAPTIWDRRR